MPYPIPEQQQAPHQPHLEENSTAEDCTYRSIEVEAEQTQGLPGEYLSAYSAKNDKLYVTGIFNITPDARFNGSDDCPREPAYFGN